MRFDLDVQNFITKKSQTTDISKITNTKLSLQYYESKGITHETSVKDWIYDLAIEKYPPQHTLIKLIKKLRKNNGKATAPTSKQKRFSSL